MKRFARLLAVGAVAAAATVAQAQVPPFTQCPPVGVDTSCETLIVINANGSITVLSDLSQPAFDGVGGDETLVGVQNNSSSTVNALSLSSITDIFGFDGDGLCGAFPAPAGCPFGPSGYEGPGVTFTVDTVFSGKVSFSPGIPPGGSAFFSLEEEVRTFSVGICGNGIRDAGELCDEGPANGTSASCCSATCGLQCDDGNPCTDDTCSSLGGSFVCGFTNNTAPCEDGNPCTILDQCAGGQCQSGIPNPCDDFNPCTDDFCSTVMGCFVIPNNAPCDDFNPCTSNDQCFGFGGCQGTPNSAPCDDFNACTENDHCQFGFCGGGTPVDCDDHNPCTADSCSPFSGCIHLPLSGKCDDQNPCTTDDVCLNGQCVGDPRNCFDDDPCTVDSCNSAGGAFLCQHEDCNNVPNSSCPAQCRPVYCGNGRIDFGETCDPPDPTPQPGRPGEVKCRQDCTFCGDAVLQTSDGETCDDANLVSGCDPLHPTRPLDACQTSCTPPICQDPARIRNAGGIGTLSVHGRIEPVAPATTLDPSTADFVVELTSDDGIVLFRTSLDAGLIQAHGRGFKYVDRAAKLAGGIGSLKFAPRGTSYRVTLTAYGDLSDAIGQMTTRLFIGAQQWTLRGQWVATRDGWQLDPRSALGTP